MIRLNAFARLEAGARRGELIAAAAELVKLSRKENGCVSYDFFASDTHSRHFMFCETWADEDALASHAASEHFIRLVATIEEITGPLKLEKFTF
ncbi:MAG: antibiotic biosynthesis monooxygenase [Muribaculaceae bacterium]|nr:antibiotic biosynthesis monooxygenase [Muribaculaceae bacterium]